MITRHNAASNILLVLIVLFLKNVSLIHPRNVWKETDDALQDFLITEKILFALSEHT